MCIRDRFTAFHFTLDDEGEVIGVRDDREMLIRSSSVSLDNAGAPSDNSAYRHFFGDDGSWRQDSAIGSQ